MPSLVSKSSVEDCLWRSMRCLRGVVFGYLLFFERMEEFSGGGHARTHFIQKSGDVLWISHTLFFESATRFYNFRVQTKRSVNGFLGRRSALRA